MNRTHQFETKKLNRNKFRKKKETILNDNDNLAHLSDKIDSLGIDKPKETNNNTLINENNQDSFSSKIVKKAVVSVKKFVDTTKNDEVTKLFRSMIGIDNNLNIDSTQVRQFACRNCYRSWWRRVRISKQVSICTKCHFKYDPVPFEKEFGTCEFNCKICSSTFYKWCSKEGFIQCKNCNTDCKPTKILINSQNKNSLLQSFNNASCSSSSSNSSIVMDGASNIQQNELNSRYSYRNRFNNNYYSFKVRCQYCNDTNINLNSTIVFRPQNNPLNNQLQQSSYSINRHNSDLSFCSYCRKIPVFSDQHISTGSTLDSLSYQGDLDIRNLDDEIDNLEPCIEQNSDEEQFNNE